MRLTVCMIARDEAQRLPLALESVRGVADEIIVVDTGSVDDTVAVARRAGARVFHHPWSDDFATARNAGIQHVRGKWMFILDCDERLVQESCEGLDALLARDDTLGYGLRRHDFVHGLKPGAPRGPYVANIVLRILRADMGITFTGRCHEQPSPGLNELTERTGLKIFSTPITLDHDCDYFSAGRPKKLSRNLRLLEMEVRERPGHLYFMIQCAASLLQFPESFAKGHAMMREVLEMIVSLRNAPRPPHSLVLIALEYAAFGTPPGPLPFTPDEAIDLADRWFPNAASVVWMRARREYERGDYDAAVPLLRRLLTMGRTHAYDLQMPFDPAVVGDDARMNLGVCLVRQGELDEAESMFNQIAATAPRAGDAKANLAVISSLRKQFAE